jgi:hypothetical protein
MAWLVEGVGLGMEVMWRAVEGPLPLVMSVGGLLEEIRRGDSGRTYRLHALLP